MKALTFQGRETIQYESVLEPEIKAPQDAIVKVRLTAICGFDLHVFHERDSDDARRSTENQQDPQGGDGT